MYEKTTLGSSLGSIRNDQFFSSQSRYIKRFYGEGGGNVSHRRSATTDTKITGYRPASVSYSGSSRPV